MVGCMRDEAQDKGQDGIKSRPRRKRLLGRHLEWIEEMKEAWKPKKRCVEEDRIKRYSQQSILIRYKWRSQNLSSDIT